MPETLLAEHHVFRVTAFRAGRWLNVFMLAALLLDRFLRRYSNDQEEVKERNGAVTCIDAERHVKTDK